MCQNHITGKTEKCFLLTGSCPAFTKYFHSPGNNAPSASLGRCIYLTALSPPIRA